MADDEQPREWPDLSHKASGALEVRLTAARDLSIPLPSDAGPSDIIRRRLFAGESVNRNAVMEEFGVSTPFLAQIVSLLRQWGYVIKNELVQHEDGTSSTTYTLLNPEQEPIKPIKPEKQPTRLTLDAKKRRDRERQREYRATKQKAVEPAATNGHTPGLPALPTLGDQVQVSFLAIGNDGDVRVGIRRGEQSWLLKLEGATE